MDGLIDVVGEFGEVDLRFPGDGDEFGEVDLGLGRLAQFGTGIEFGGIVEDDLTDAAQCHA